MWSRENSFVVRVIVKENRLRRESWFLLIVFLLLLRCWRILFFKKFSIRSVEHIASCLLGFLKHSLFLGIPSNITSDSLFGNDIWNTLPPLWMQVDLTHEPTFFHNF